MIVDEGLPGAGSGALVRPHVEAAWIWVLRDLAPDLLSAERAAAGSMTAAEFESVAADILARIKHQLSEAASDPNAARRLRLMLGSDEAVDALPRLMTALRHRALLPKAQTFGRSINGIAEEAGLTAALQSMPLQDPVLAGLLFQSAIGQVQNPTRLVLAAIRISGGAGETFLLRAGFGPLIDGLLAHAQNQLHLLQPLGTFADIDLTCRGLDRYHRLIRAVAGYVELPRGGRWAGTLSYTTRQVSERVEPRLRSLVTDINLAMRRGREGSDRLDDNAILAAIGGVYLLATVRECRDSLALNAVFDQAWTQSGQALEMHIERYLDLLRRNPGDRVVGARLDAAI